MTSVNVSGKEIPKQFTVRISNHFGERGVSLSSTTTVKIATSVSIEYNCILSQLTTFALTDS